MGKIYDSKIARLTKWGTLDKISLKNKFPNMECEKRAKKLHLKRFSWCNEPENF